MKTLEEIFNDVTLIGQTPNLILSVDIPDKIYLDVLSWVNPCRTIKDDKFAQLLNHVNGETNINTYQTSIPKKFIDNSFFLGYLIKFGELYLKIANVSVDTKKVKPIYLRNYPGHYDGYDIWMNFTYKGDDNPEHNHSGSLSGIIYVKDPDCQPTNFPTINYTHNGKEGEILIFPSQLLHSVDIKQTDCERITASFNLDIMYS